MKNAEKGLFLIDILTDRSILRWLRMNFKAFPPESRANLSGNHGRNRECSFSQIRNLLKTNTSRISGLPKKWQTGGRDKCLSAAEPSEFLKVWLIRIPSFCVDDSNSVPILPLPIIFFCTIGPGSSIHKLYDLRSPNSQPSELGNLTMHVLDYIKDGWMANYLFRRLGFINSRCNLLSGLVYVYGASIGVAGVLMAFVFQTDSALLGFDSSTNWCCIAFVRCLLFVLAPFLPIIVIMKAVELKRKKEVLEAMYRDISTDATAKWERSRELDEEEQDVVEALSDLKMVVCSTEAVVQFLLLVIFTFASVLLPSTSGLGLLKDDNSYDWTFLVFSFLTTIVTVNKAILDAIDIRKKRQLDFKQKVILGMSFTFQILSHVFLIVPVGLLALPLADSPADDGSKDASLTVTLPRSSLSCQSSSGGSPSPPSTTALLRIRPDSGT